MVYFHQSGDAPTVEEYISIVHAFLSYAYYNGEVTEAVIVALLGVPPTATPDISKQLDAWA